MKIGPYEVRRQLGRGGMGTVYEALDPIGRVVALKVLSRAGNTSVQLERFRREAQALAALRHPNVVSVHAAGETDDALWLSMDLVEGRSLEELIAHGPIEVRRAALLGAKVARALAAAHKAGIVHRDVKPANVLLDKHGAPDGEAGEPRLADFGLARVLDAKSLTQTGAVLGTPYYMAPEQAAGLDTTERTDVYALGLVLYELVGGRRPFEGESARELVMKILTEPPPPLVGTAPPFAAIVERALEKEPLRRYASADAIAADLEAFARGAPISIRLPGPREKFRRAVERRPRLAAAVAAIVALPIVVVAAALVLGSKPDAAKTVVASSPPARTPHEKALEDGRAAERRGDFATAVTAFGSALDARAQEPLALAGRGRAELGQDDLAAAERTLENAAPALPPGAPAPEAAATWAALARAILDRVAFEPDLGRARDRDLERAGEASRRATKLDPKDPLVQATFARAEVALGRGAQVATQLDHMPAGEAAFELALARAAWRLKRGEHASALESARSAARGPTRDAAVAAVLLSSLDEPEEARRILERAVAARPRTGAFRLGLARALADDLDFPAAEREELAAADLGSKDPALTKRLFVARDGVGPDSDDRALVDRAWYLIHFDPERDPAKALLFLQRIEVPNHQLQAGVTSSDIAYVRVSALMALRKESEADLVLDAAVRESPEHRGLRRERALLRGYDYSIHLDDANRVLAHAPDDLEMAGVAVEALLGLDRVPDALDLAVRTRAALPPADPRGIELVGETFLQAGRWSEARTTLEQAGDAATPRIRELLERAARRGAAPLGPPPGFGPLAGVSLGRASSATWAPAPALSSAEVSVVLDRDPRRAAGGLAPYRIDLRGGTSGIFYVAAPPSRPFDLSHAHAVRFRIAAEAWETASPAASPNVALGFIVAGEEVSWRVDLRSDWSTPGWKEIRVPIEPPADDRIDVSRIARLAIFVESIPPAGVSLWLDDVAAE